MLESIKNSEFVVFDTETTGLDHANGDEIIEIAAERVKADAVIEKFHHLLNPTADITPEAYSVHGLSKIHLAEHGKAYSEIMPAFVEFCKDAVLVGHNILAFDIHFVNKHLQEIEQPPLSNLVIDTLTMARKLLPQLPNHKLTTLATYFNIDPEGAHRADKDVEMNRIVFMELLKIYFEKETKQADGKTLL